MIEFISFEGSKVFDKLCAERVGHIIYILYSIEATICRNRICRFGVVTSFFNVFDNII